MGNENEKAKGLKDNEVGQSELMDGLWQKPEKATPEVTTFAYQNPELFKEHCQGTPHGCPNCKGMGKVSRPPHIAGDQQQWVDNGAGPYSCPTCGGAGVIWG